MPVAWASTSAIRPSSTTAWDATSPLRHCFSRRRRSARSDFSSSRSDAAFSKSWSSDACSFWRRTSAIFSSNSRSSGGARQDRQAQAGAGLVDQVDGLVGQEAVAHVAVGEVRGRDDRAVRDLHLVVRLVAVAQTLQDVDRVGQARLGDLDRLEAALERSILLEVLAVLVERRRTDRLQLAAGEERLQDADAASIAPSAAPAPTRVWISSMKTMMSPRVRISFVTFLRRSSKSPR